MPSNQLTDQHHRHRQWQNIWYY